MTTKSVAFSKEEMLDLVNNFFGIFERICNQDKAPSPSDLDRLLTRNFTMNSNGQTQCRSLTDYLKRLVNLRSKYTHFDIAGPLEAPIISDNQIALHYEMDLKGRDGEDRQVYIMATATLQDGKISNWIQVTHEKNFHKWDA
jgi:hypothetical protein